MRELSLSIRRSIAPPLFRQIARFATAFNTKDPNVLETWDDLLYVDPKVKYVTDGGIGVAASIFKSSMMVRKHAKLLHREDMDKTSIAAPPKEEKRTLSIAPWNLITINERLAKNQQNMTIMLQESDLEATQEKSVTNLMADFRHQINDIKKELDKKYKEKIKLIEKKRMTVFHDKFNTLSHMYPVLEKQLAIMGTSKNLGLQKSSKHHMYHNMLSALEEDTPEEWMTKLRNECADVGCYGNAVVIEILNKLSKFPPSHNANGSTNWIKGKEKLCLLVMSLPVCEICTVPFQLATKFVLEEVLSGNAEMLQSWMTERKIPVVKFPWNVKLDWENI